MLHHNSQINKSRSASALTGLPPHCASSCPLTRSSKCNEAVLFSTQGQNVPQPRIAPNEKNQNNRKKDQVSKSTSRQNFKRIQSFRNFFQCSSRHLGGYRTAKPASISLIISVFSTPSFLLTIPLIRPCSSNGNLTEIVTVSGPGLRPLALFLMLFRSLNLSTFPYIYNIPNSTHFGSCCQTKNNQLIASKIHLNTCDYKPFAEVNCG